MERETEREGKIQRERERERERDPVEEINIIAAILIKPAGYQGEMSIMLSAK